MEGEAEATRRWKSLFLGLLWRKISLVGDVKSSWRRGTEGREGGREEGRKGGREGGREGRREEGEREDGREEGRGRE